MKFHPIFFQGGKGGGGGQKILYLCTSTLYLLHLNASEVWWLQNPAWRLLHIRSVSTFSFSISNIFSTSLVDIFPFPFSKRYTAFDDHLVFACQIKKFYLHLELLVPPARPVWYPSPPVLRSGEPCRNNYTLSWSFLCILLRYVTVDKPCTTSVRPSIRSSDVSNKQTVAFYHKLFSCK